MVSYGSARGTRVERDHRRVAALIPAEPAGIVGVHGVFGACYRKANLAAVAAGPNVT